MSAQTSPSGIAARSSSVAARENMSTSPSNRMKICKMSLRDHCWKVLDAMVLRELTWLRWPRERDRATEAMRRDNPKGRTFFPPR